MFLSARETVLTVKPVRWAMSCSVTRRVPEGRLLIKPRPFCIGWRRFFQADVFYHRYLIFVIPAQWFPDMSAADSRTAYAGLHGEFQTHEGEIFRTILFIPVLCSVVIAGIIFRMMFSELPGAMMNQLRAVFGLEDTAWLKGEGTAMFARVLLAFDFRRQQFAQERWPHHCRLPVSLWL